jgi:hypothetical protein
MMTGEEPSGVVRSVVFPLLERYGFATAVATAMIAFFLLVVDRKLDIIAIGVTTSNSHLVSRQSDHMNIMIMLERHMEDARREQAEVIYLLRSICLNAAVGAEVQQCGGPRQ